MKSSFIIFGGSKGLGKKIVELASDKEYVDNIISVSRDSIDKKIKKLVNHQMDILNTDSEEIKKFIENYWPIKAICFCQRYRFNSEFKTTSQSQHPINEYKLSVDFIGKFIDQFMEFLDMRKNIEEIFPIKILIIGSTYSKHSGFDQDWSYHCTKAAQASLVKYYSIRTRGDFTINMLSPATFIKEGAKYYWQNQKKFALWKNYSNKGLATVNQIAEASIHYLFKSSIYINGQNIIIDNGLSNLYPDQGIEF